MDVSENCPPACTVGRVSAVDPDTGLTNNIRYRDTVIVKLARVFFIENNGGKIQINCVIHSTEVFKDGAL